MASRLDVDPAEPRREGGRRGRHNGEPTIPVDQADDLAQHRSEAAVAEPACVVEAKGQVVVSAPEPYEALGVTRVDDDRPGWPRHPGGVCCPCHGDYEATFGTQGFGDHP